MEENSEVQEILAQLKDKELAYVMARRKIFSNLKAAEKANLSKDWWYSLTEEDKARLNIFADRLRRADAKAVIALNTLCEAVEEAASVQVASLKDRDPRIRLASSDTILNRVLGKPLQPTDVSGTIEVNVNDVRETIQRKLAGIATNDDAE